MCHCNRRLLYLPRGRGVQGPVDRADQRAEEDVEGFEVTSPFRLDGGDGNSEVEPGRQFNK